MKYLLILLLLVPELFSAIKRVPQDFPKIQTAINNSANGDTVLVSPGIYFENLRLNGKKIVLASTYIFTNEPRSITGTVINGSQAANPDSASCILVINGEDSTTVIEGFTLTGGKGTVWTDEHGAGVYREGGAILTAFSSPVIRNNYIYGNSVAYQSDLASTGGGGMRCGDGSPKIINNVIMQNEGMYGGGIVLNYCSGALVQNNVITNNKVYQMQIGVPTYGGGGLWINNHLPGNNTPNSVINNTIAGNSAFGEPGTSGAGKGGGIFLLSASVVLLNNIVWKNEQTTDQIGIAPGSQVIANYNCTEEFLGGTSNISVYPAFWDSCLYLSPNSPCVDNGDPDVKYNDKNISGTPVFPARGTVRNDIGAYGGPMARSIFNFSKAIIRIPDSLDFGLLLPGGNINKSLEIVNSGSAKMRIDSLQIPFNLKNLLSVITAGPYFVNPLDKAVITINWHPQTNILFKDSIKIFHNATGSLNPVTLKVKGSSIPTPLLSLNTAMLTLGDININTVRIDTSFYIKNIGTGGDSLFIKVNPKTVNPPSALDVNPKVTAISPGDSVKIEITIFPSQIIKSGTGIYIPVVEIKPKYSLDTATIKKEFRFRLTGILDVNESDMPVSFELEQNYPNPFNPSTTINYKIAESGNVRISVFDILGNKINDLVNEYKPAGSYSVIFGGNGLASGIYLYSMQVNGKYFYKKMEVLK